MHRRLPATRFENPRLSYRGLKRLLAGFLAAYFLIGMLWVLEPRHPRLFPVVSWNVYASVPAISTHFGLRIHSNAGKRFSPPLSLLGPDGVCVADPDSHLALQLLGEAMERRDAARSEGLRRQLERRCLAAPFRYEVVQEKADELIRLRTGRMETRVLGVFTSR